MNKEYEATYTFYTDDCQGSGAAIVSAKNIFTAESYMLEQIQKKGYKLIELRLRFYADTTTIH